MGKQGILNMCCRTQFEYLSEEKKNTEKNKSGFDYICWENTEPEHICKKKRKKKKKKEKIVEEDEWPRHSLKKVIFIIV